MKEKMQKKKIKSTMKWFSMDLHIHTRASSDYQQPEVTYLDILKRAETRGLDIIAFSDHNTVAGYRQMREEIQQLELLKNLKRILPEEQARLDEYDRLLAKILVLPAFEFTATFGFHIIGVFPPEKPLREIEHILLELKVPPDQLDAGSVTVGAASDVLTAYRLIAESGGLVIAAHANSSNGVAMRGFNFGGQTKIAFTQDPHLHALEVTDLDRKGPGSTAAFFNGTKPEYPRRMHCIQASDCHRLIADPQRKKNLGVGDRATDVLLPEADFQALLELFLGNDFSRTRPHRHTEEPAFDFLRAAREEGPNIIQDFHESMTVRGGKRYAIIADVCAFANTNGGTLYIGFSANPKEPVVGVPDHLSSLSQLEKEIDNRISPPLNCTIDVQETNGKKILRILVPRGEDPPYAVDENKIYIRSEAETNLAVRDEIVSLVLRNARLGRAGQPSEQPLVSVEAVVAEPGQAPFPPAEPPVDLAEIQAPRTGVEVVAVEERKGDRVFTLRDLRNGNIVKNVTRASARRLWHYAITTYNALPADLSKSEIYWQGNLGLLKQYKQGKDPRFDLVHRQGDKVHYYFGVTEDGIDGPWLELVGLSGSEDDDG
jgi:PHP family Zn ribbon phosphoesterase